MYLSTITLKNFRKYAYDGANKHGITVNFHKGLNALIGENDSGKSAIIDAIKLVLQTQSGEFTRVMDEDFYISATGEIATEFSIDCIFEGFEINEAKNFVEWLSFEKDKTSGTVFYKLFLHYRAWRENGRIYTELKAGDVEDGISLDGKARELLKCVYLRPLRDAQKEMHSGRNSRISQILFSHPLFSNKEDNALVTLIMQANEGIERYFLEEEGREILGKIRSTLTEFLDEHASKDASIKTSEMRLKSILESLSLVAPEVQPGLGVYNLLFIAAELLLLNSDTNGSLKLSVIEELEAHLHGVKGETHDATLYLETETKKSSDIRRILPLLERKITQCKNELQEKSRRCVYVGFSRPKYLLCLAISEKTYVGHETAFSSWKIVDLRSKYAT